MSRPRLSPQALRWLEVILAERFGHAWSLSSTPTGLVLCLNGGKGQIIFDKVEDCFGESRSDIPFTTWDAAAEGWESVLGSALPSPGAGTLPQPLIEKSPAGFVVHYDVLGLTYWMLARVEEIGRKDLDQHGRFPASASHAYKQGYLDRPIVDEWVHILGQVMNRQWPTIELKQHEFSMQVSHDVDQLSLYAFKSWRTIGRMMTGHLLKRCDPVAFIAAPYVKLATRKKLISADPYNTFEWLMDISEQNNLRSAFYFMCGRTDPARDADYEIEHPAIRNLMSRIHERGHELGLHPSYGTYQRPELFKAEAEKLKRVCEEEGAEQFQLGGRMHYLRWEQPTTMRAWADAGMDYDSTLGYADHPGFRCGTCYEYPAFDAVRQEQLRLRIRPLVVMECSVIDKAYAGLGVTEDAANLINTLKERCLSVNGVFALLWHNSYLQTRELKNLYLGLFHGNNRHA